MKMKVVSHYYGPRVWADGWDLIITPCLSLLNSNGLMCLSLDWLFWEVEIWFGKDLSAVSGNERKDR